MTALSQPPPSTHSGRLKYANAHDLPSFPSSGLKDDDIAATANVAASLGWTTKPLQHWAPGPSSAASTAALLANDAQMAAPGAEVRRAATGSQAAAALAAGGAALRNQPSQVSPPSEWVNSAATLAFKASTSPPSVNTSEPPSLARQGSLRAAKGAMDGRRRRAASSPMPRESYPDQANAASNALSAATIAHRPSVKAPPHPAGGAVPFIVMDRQMYTSNPPVKAEVDEKQRNDTIHASAMAMAKEMYSRQQSVINTNSANAHARSSSFSRHGGDGRAAEEEKPMAFDNLQEAAYRLAQERLNKLQEEHDRNRGYKEYYGASAPQRNNKIGSIRNKLTRRRSSSDGALLEDKKRSMQIRKQMSLFDTKIAEVDEQKRLRDREALLATAHRNVQARLKDMDQKIQEETGWIQPSNTDDWERKARVAAQARFDASKAEKERKVDIGGGKVMDREAIDAIAAKRVQPLLDEINEKAEVERQRRLQLQAEEEKRKLEEERDKAREREVQEIHKQLKEQQRDQDRLRREELRREERERKEEEKRFKVEQRRIAREGKQKGKEVIPPLNLNGPIVENPPPKAEESQTQPATTPGRTGALSINFKRHTKKKSHDSMDSGPEGGGATNKMKTWFKTHLTRPRSHSSPDAVQADAPKKKFIGGAALAKLTGRNSSTPSVDGRASSSMRDVALAGRADESALRNGSLAAPKEGDLGESSTIMTPPRPAYAKVRTPSPRPRGGDRDSMATRSTMSVSSMSSSNDEFEEARTTLSSPVSPITPPAPRHLRIGAEVDASPVRGSRFSEILE